MAQVHEDCFTSCPGATTLEDDIGIKSTRFAKLEGHMARVVLGRNWSLEEKQALYPSCAAVVRRMSNFVSIGQASRPVVSKVGLTVGGWD